MSVTNKNNANIVWHVKPANAFKFTTDGIKFVAKQGGGLPDPGQLDKTNSSDTTWTVHDRNTQAGTFHYEVTGHEIVPADDLAVLKTHHKELLTLQACHPRFFATHRYLAYAKLVRVEPRDGRPYTLGANGPIA